MPAGVALSEVVSYLDQYLRIREIPDDPRALNGLQVENTGMIGSIVAAVDASQATIDGVIAGLEAGETPPLLLVHHGDATGGWPDFWTTTFRCTRHTILWTYILRLGTTLSWRSGSGCGWKDGLASIAGWQSVYGDRAHPVSSRAKL
jgi:hypothetical protein